MWNLSSDDVNHAKERISRRRAELEARYAEERQALDAEDAVVETLERSAAEFANKYAGQNIAEATSVDMATPEPEAASEMPSLATAPGEAAVGGDAKHGSRWRLHLGGRPDGDNATVGAIATR
jgi:hypothetical protein